MNGIKDKKMKRAINEESILINVKEGGGERYKCEYCEKEVIYI